MTVVHPKGRLAKWRRTRGLGLVLGVVVTQTGGAAAASPIGEAEVRPPWVGSEWPDDRFSVPVDAGQAPEPNRFGRFVSGPVRFSAPTIVLPSTRDSGETKVRRGALEAISGAFAVVPLPATLTLLLTALGALVGIRQIRRHAEGR